MRPDKHWLKNQNEAECLNYEPVCHPRAIVCSLVDLFQKTHVSSFVCQQNVPITNNKSCPICPEMSLSVNVAVF